MIQNDNELEEFVITEDEWIHYEGINNLLAPFEEATVRISGSSYPTIQTVIPIYDKLTMITMLEFKEKEHTSGLVKKAAAAGKKKLQKYYDKTTNYHDIATVLDPRLKLEFFKRENFKKEYVSCVKDTYEIFKKTLFQIYQINLCYFHYRFNRLYEKNYKSFQDEVPNCQKSNSTESSIFDSIYDTTISIENRVENYLTTKCEHRSTDPLLFW